MVDEDAVPSAGQVERDVLVGLLGAGAAVLVPHGYGLAVFHESAEPLPQAVDLLVHGQAQLLAHIGTLALVIGHARPVLLEKGKIPARAFGQKLPVPLIAHGPGALAQNQA